MLKPQYARGTNRLSFWYVLPTPHLRRLVYRQLLRQYPQLHYANTWFDAKGYGLHMAHDPRSSAVVPKLPKELPEYYQ